MRKFVFLLFAIVASVSYSQEYWTKYAAKTFASGSGTEEDPYIIETPEELAKLSADLVVSDFDYEGTYFRLDSDIDLDGKLWLSIGTDLVDADNNKIHREFSGIFDGNGHKVLNLVGEYGLFGYTTLDAEIRNLTIESGTLSGQNMVGGIVGSNSGLIENCVNKASVSALFSYPGGIAGCNIRGSDGSPSGIIRNCVNYGRISSQEDSSNGMGSGGIAGTSSSIIENCANYGEISSKTAQAAGIVANLDGGYVRNCYNAGKIYSKEQAAGCIGAILARTTSCTVYSLYNIGEVDSESDFNGTMAGNVIFVYQPIGGYNASARNLYGNSSACPGLEVVRDHFISVGLDLETCQLKTTDGMASQVFADELNEAGDTDVWVIKEGINAGCPTFEWIDTPFTVDIEDVENELMNLDVYGSNGRITVSGVSDAMISVYAFSGELLIQGDINTVSSVQFEDGIYLVSVRANGETRNLKVSL